MESDLLRKEVAYRLENEKIELRTKELLQKVEDVMKKQDNLIKETEETKAEVRQLKSNSLFFASSCETTTPGEQNLLKAHASSNSLTLPNFPKSVHEMGSKAQITFFKAQLKSLQTDNEKLQTNLKKKADELKKLETEKSTLAEEKEKWFLKYNTAKNLSAKFEKQISELNSKVESKDNELIALRKGSDSLQKELKNTSGKLNCNEVRLNRSLEENERIKTNLKVLKQSEKENFEVHRKQIRELENTVRTIERHKSELLHNFKKQQQLIENLKQQKANLEILKLSELAERDYNRILDWKPGTELGTNFLTDF